MEEIVWDDSFSVGVDEIDEQHKGFFRIINELIAAGNVPTKSESISNALDKLTKYADNHFKAEEKYMIQQGYPEYPSHKEEHDQFKKKVATFCLDVMEGKAAVSDEMLSFLRNWLVHHILDTDLKSEPFG